MELVQFNELDDAWLGIDTESLNGIDVSHHPLFIKDKFMDEHPGIKEISCMRNPEYIGYVAHELLGIRLHPFQMLIQYQLWTHSFPMLIATRGGSKCLNPYTYVQTTDGFMQLGDLVQDNPAGTHVFYKNNLQVLGENGFHKLEYAWKNKKQKTIKLTTNYGYNIEGLPEHKLRVIDGDGKYVWKFLNEVKVDDIVPIDRSEDWFPNTNDLTESEGYFIGAIIGDGCYGKNKKNGIGFTTADHDYFPDKLLPVVVKHGAVLKKYKAKYQYGIVQAQKLRKKMFEDWGMKIANSGDKEVPNIIFGAKKSVVASFISGLFDTDGCCCTKKSIVEYSSKSYELISGVQFLLSRFGINARLKKQLNKKYNRYYYKLIVGGSSLRKFNEEIGFGLERKQTLLDKHCSISSNDNTDVIPKSIVKEDILRLKAYAKERGGLSWKEFTASELKLMTPCRINAYDISYNTLERILQLAYYPECEYWQTLNKVLKKHYFYDRVKRLEVGESETIDMYLEDDHTYISNGVVSHNSFSLGLYALLACVLNPEYKVIIAGASFRQSKMIFEYVEKMWNQSPMIRSMCSRGSKTSKDVDRWTFKINDSTITAIPIGNGEKIRGLRSNCIIVDEMASHNPQILEEVVFGFGAVASNPMEKVVEKARRKKAKELGYLLDTLDMDDLDPFSKNKSIVTGTADYYFNHFYEYWKRYKKIVASQGDPKKLEEIFHGEVPKAFNWKEYCVIRIPYSLLPEGFMDDETVARAKAQMPESLYLKEYEAIFVEDSDGFFKRSLIESCVASDRNTSQYNWVPYCPVPFEPITRGDPNGTYVFGVDPAAKDDNFAVVILEVHKEHTRIVHCWTTNEADFIKRKKAGFTDLDDYYAFCVWKIRELAKVFPTNSIGIDTQGGGYAIMEKFADTNYIKQGEEPFYQYIDWSKPKDTDNLKGRHIIYPIQFASAQWTHDANWGLKADLEGRTILFPNFDELTAELSIAQDKIRKEQFKQKYGGAVELVLFDSLEDCAEEIEELKDELTNIVYSKTPAGRERWDVPDVKINKQDKASGKKDRYSALIIANFLARDIVHRKEEKNTYECAGGFVRGTPSKKSSKKGGSSPLYNVDWFTW